MAQRSDRAVCGDCAARVFGYRGDRRVGQGAVAVIQRHHQGALTAHTQGWTHTLNMCVCACVHTRVWTLSFRVCVRTTSMRSSTMPSSSSARSSRLFCPVTTRPLAACWSSTC